MTQLRGVFASLLIGCLFARVVAAEDPAVLLAAKDVVNANSQGGFICKGIAPDPSRADRTKLAKLITALPDLNVRYPFGYEDTTPLGLAVLADDVELLDRLFAKGARWRPDTFDSEVMYEAARFASDDQGAFTPRSNPGRPSPRELDRADGCGLGEPPRQRCSLARSRR
jgi:hypothetical protein